MNRKDRDIFVSGLQCTLLHMLYKKGSLPMNKKMPKIIKPFIESNRSLGLLDVIDKKITLTEKGKDVAKILDEAVTKTVSVLDKLPEDEVKKEFDDFIRFSMLEVNRAIDSPLLIMDTNTFPVFGSIDTGLEIPLGSNPCLAHPTEDELKEWEKLGGIGYVEYNPPTEPKEEK